MDKKQIEDAQTIWKSYMGWFTGFVSVNNDIAMGHVIHITLLNSFKAFTKLLEFKKFEQPKERFEFRKARNKFLVEYLLTHPEVSPDQLLDQEFNELSNDVVCLSETHKDGQKDYSAKEFISEKKKKQGVCFS